MASLLFCDNTLAPMIVDNAQWRHMAEPEESVVQNWRPKSWVGVDCGVNQTGQAHVAIWTPCSRFPSRKFASDLKQTILSFAGMLTCAICLYFVTPSSSFTALRDQALVSSAAMDHHQNRTSVSSPIVQVGRARLGG